MKRIYFLLVYLCLTLCAFSQTREDVRVFIPAVIGTPEQAAFFHENFTSEARGAGYTVTDDAKIADYTLKLDVGPNIVYYNDGTSEQAPAGEPQFVLNVHLLRNEDDAEIISLFYPFTELEEMYDFNLYLLYQAMANVPLTKHGSVAEEKDHWRNKWIYIRTSVDYPITSYALKTNDTYGAAIWNSEDPYKQGSNSIKLDNIISPWLGVTVGIEFQYLSWMSTEANFSLNFKDPMGNAFIPTVNVQQKFPLKPSKYFMIEPYGLVSFPMNTSSKAVKFPKVGAGGGLQIGVKGGSMGAFFIDVNYIHYFNDAVMANTNSIFKYPATVEYKRFIVGLGAGYKIGFGNRNK